jgi:methionyl aminopeptidase
MESTGQNKDMVNKCNNCEKEAKLRCPDCKKLRVKEQSYFCGKECFKSSWNEHKKVHVECK